MENNFKRAAFIGAVISTCSIVTNYYWGENVSNIVTIIYILFAITKNPNICFALVIMAIPNTKALSLFGVSASVCICTIIVFFHILNNHIVNTKIFLLLSLYLVYSLQYIVRFNDFKYGLIMPLKMIAVISYFFIISDSEYLAKDSMQLVKQSMFSLFLGVMATTVMTIIVKGAITRLAVIGNDPNILAVEASFIVATSLVLYIEKKEISTTQFILLVVGAAFIVLLTGSRMGLLLLGFSSMFCIFLTRGKIGRKLSLVLIVGLGIFIFLNLSIGQQVITTLLRRNAALIEDGNITNDRIELWTRYISTFNRNKWLWFFGLGNYEYYGIDRMAHNFLIEDISDYGIIGCIILYALYILVFRNIYSNVGARETLKTKFIYLLPFAIPIIGGISLHGLTNIPNTTMLFLGFLSICSFSKAESSIAEI